MIVRMDGLTSTVRRLGWPGPIACMLTGVALSFMAPSLRILVTPELVLLVLLPGLVFEGAYRLHWEDLVRSYGSIAFLAVPGVIISAAIVALGLWAVTGLRPELAFVVGAMVSATDPAAVIATFTRLRAPRRLIAIVDAESLLNDGTGLVLFAVAIAVVSRDIAPTEAVWLFGWTIAGSVALGAGAGFAASLGVVHAPSRGLAVALTVLCAYGTYLVAATLGLSGVLASVIAGIVLGNHGRHIGLTEATERAFDAVWEPLAALLTALIFLAVGVAIGRSGALEALAPIAKRTGAVLVCSVTAPSWGPVFPKIAAAVSDIGGMMSHAAIVAREYGLPAVVGTGNATSAIKTGDRVRVDGNTGIVTIL